MAKAYYYLVAGLPDLIFDASKQASGLADFKEFVEGELSPEDYQLIESWFWKYDNKLILGWLQQKLLIWQPAANIAKADYEHLYAAGNTQFNTEREVPDYIHQFIAAFKADTPLVEAQSWENQLAGLLLQYQVTLDNPFITEWYRFENGLNNILVALNCRKHGLEPASHIIGNNDVAEKILGSTARDFGLGNDFPKVEQILALAEIDNLLEREKRYDLLRWELLDELSFFHYFTVEAVFAHMVKLEIAERWLALDPKTGRELFVRLLSGIKAEASFPEEFTQKK